VIIADLQQHPQDDLTAASAHIRAYMGVPIQLQDSVIGFINLLSEQPDYFGDKDAERLSAFAELAAIAIQNARLYQESQELAAVKERQRLARDLHDSVSQTLFTCRTMSETALRRWEKDPASAYELIRDVNQLITTGLAEMRILLLELRPAALAEVSLKQLFEQYLQPIQDRRKFELVLTIADIPPLPPQVQLALYRIAQEALNNIDKHAQASRVEVRAAGDSEHVTMLISDDGRGFEPTVTAATSLGLAIMRERADEIGAALDIISQINAGTHIKVTWRKETS
jgi:signal transduction histidine kinase